MRNDKEFHRRNYWSTLTRASCHYYRRTYLVLERKCCNCYIDARCKMIRTLPGSVTRALEDKETDLIYHNSSIIQCALLLEENKRNDHAKSKPCEVFQ
jgi:hypothetical protein